MRLPCVTMAGQIINAPRSLYIGKASSPILASRILCIDSIRARAEGYSLYYAKELILYEVLYAVR